MLITLDIISQKITHLEDNLQLYTIKTLISNRRVIYEYNILRCHINRQNLFELLLKLLMEYFLVLTIYFPSLPLSYHIKRNQGP